MGVIAISETQKKVWSLQESKSTIKIYIKFINFHLNSFNIHFMFKAPSRWTSHWMIQLNLSQKPPDLRDHI